MPVATSYALTLPAVSVTSLSSPLSPPAQPDAGVALDLGVVARDAGVPDAAIASPADASGAAIDLSGSVPADAASAGANDGADASRSGVNVMSGCSVERRGAPRGWIFAIGIAAIMFRRRR